MSTSRVLTVLVLTLVATAPTGSPSRAGSAARIAVVFTGQPWVQHAVGRLLHGLCPDLAARRGETA
ncbi:MAG: hypothetical protein U0821_20910 [Chloroflexota bacterium]